MAGKHVAAPSPRQGSGWRRFERPLAVIGAAAVIVVGIESVSLAATGSTFILGRSNTASSTTVITNTKLGSPAMSLRTKSTATAPFTTNARGKVLNLNSDKVDGLDASAIIAAGRTGGSADTLGGKTAAQIVTEARTNVNAATVGGKTPAQIVDDASAATVAFAQVSADGVVIRGTPGTAVTRTTTGFTCLTVPGFTPTTGVAVASPDWVGSSTSSGTPGTTSVVEVARQESGNCSSSSAFLIVSYRDNGTNVALSNEAFSIIITG